MVVWESFLQDGSFGGIFGQRYDNAGTPVGAEFRVNAYTSRNQEVPAVAAAADGSFVVVWEGDAPTDPSAIFARRFDSGGGALGTEFRVNTHTTNLQVEPSIASDASGNFVVVWRCFGAYVSCGVYGQRFDRDGLPQGAEFKVSGDASQGSVASDASGNFVVVWDSYGGPQDPSYGVYGQRYDSAGQLLGDEFLVNTYTTGAQYEAFVASDHSGRFVVVWQGRGQGDTDGIFARRFNADGEPQGSQFRVNSYTSKMQDQPSVVSDTAGNFVVAWRSQDQDGDLDGVFGQRYDSAGFAQGGEFQVNSYTTNDQSRVSGGATGTNEFVLVWTSWPPPTGGPGQDGSSSGVFGRGLDFSGGGTITVVNPNTNVRWPIGSLQRIQWTHDVGADATFRIELDRDDDGTFEELIAAVASVDGATKGSFAWTVTGPPTGKARVRVSWTDDLAVSDTSDVTFRIKLEG